MPGRKPLYQSDTERPVMLCVRVPRTLYDQVQHQADARRLTMTDATLDALRTWVGIEADPNGLLSYDNSNTDVLQKVAAKIAALPQLEERIVTLETVLARRGHETPTQPVADTQLPPVDTSYDNSQTVVRHETKDALSSDNSNTDVMQEPPVPDRRAGYRALADQVKAYARQQPSRFSGADVAHALHIDPKEAHQVLQRFLKQGLVEREGAQKHTTYQWLGD